MLLGGSGSRFNSRIPKQYLRLNRHSYPLFIETILNLLQGIDIRDLILVGNPEYMTEQEFLLPLQMLQNNETNLTIHVISGGASRHESFLNGANTAARNYNSGIVLVHDANRPHITPEFSLEINKAISDTSDSKPCFIPVVPSTDSLCITSKNVVEGYVPRDKIHKVQTPQVLSLTAMNNALEKKMQSNDKREFTDEGSFMKEMGFQVFTYPGSLSNIKITYPEDV